MLNLETIWKDILKDFNKLFRFSKFIYENDLISMILGK